MCRPITGYLDKTRGGAHGFNTETGPGPAIPPIESLRAMLPEDHLWPVNYVVGLSCGRRRVQRPEEFHRRRSNARYGPSAAWRNSRARRR